MEGQKGISSPQRSVSMKRFRRQFEDLKSEFFRISWVDEGDLLMYTKVVLLATFVSGMVLYIADLIVQRAVFGVDTILRFIFG